MEVMTATVNLKMLAGIAKPSPKIGQALGPLGINMMQFCKEFNVRTSMIRGDVPMKVRLTAYTDRTFKFIVKPPETSWFLHKASSMEKFTPLPGFANEGYVGIQYIYEVAKIKKQLDPDLHKVDLQQIVDMIIAQLASCGLSLSAAQHEPKPIHIKFKQ